MQPAAPITHGSKMDHFYAVDASNGFTYLGHCEQTAQTAGLLNLIHYAVVPTAELISRQNSEQKEYGVVAADLYVRTHSKTANVSLSSECRVAIHILDDLLKQLRQQGA